MKGTIESAQSRIQRKVAGFFFGLLVAVVAITAASIPVLYPAATCLDAKPKSRRSRIVDSVICDADPEELSRKVANDLVAKRIDTFMTAEGSPLAGLGPAFVDAQERTGVSAVLLASLTLAESGCGTAGSLSRTNHNAWGMKGPQPALGITAENGYCWWPDWESAINGAADFVRHYWGPAQTGLELRGYARRSGPGSSWLGRVEHAMGAIL